MTVKFSCHGQMLRFPVGLIPEAMGQETRNESFWVWNRNIGTYMHVHVYVEYVHF